MRLIEAIIDANHRALDGDKKAGLHLADYVNELPVVAMTCIDPRLTPMFPGVMGLPADSFIWLRNAGNLITDPLSSMTRSLSLACAIKGGKEIAIIGHTDCAVCHTSLDQLFAKYDAIGISRDQLPSNPTEYFKIFSCERENVIASVDRVRQSPLIGPKVPVQGLMVDIVTGRLEWVVNGYDAVERRSVGHMGLKMPEIGALGSFETKIGEIATGVKSIIHEVKPASTPAPAPAPSQRPPPIPPQRPIPVPPPITIPPKR